MIMRLDGCGACVGWESVGNGAVVEGEWGGVSANHTPRFGVPPWAWGAAVGFYGVDGAGEVEVDTHGGRSEVEGGSGMK